LNSATLASGMYILVGEVRDGSGLVKEKFRTKVLVLQ
jgi:hypothetical protein